MYNALFASIRLFNTIIAVLRLAIKTRQLNQITQKLIQKTVSGCQTLRMAASRRAKALGVETKSVRMPRCNKQGGFEEVQCDNEIVSSCWCVDASGFELPGTRAPAASLVNCTGKYRVFVYKVPIQIGMVCLEIRRHSQAHKMIE